MREERERAAGLTNVLGKGPAVVHAFYFFFYGTSSKS